MSDLYRYLMVNLAADDMRKGIPDLPAALAVIDLISEIPRWFDIPTRI